MVCFFFCTDYITAILISCSIMYLIYSNSNTVKDVVEDLDGERLVGEVTKDRVKETQNPGLDLKEDKLLSTFVSLSMASKICKCGHC